MISSRNVGIGQAMKTPQFYLLWIVLCFNVTAGIGVLGVAKTMMTEIFGSTLPAIVNAGFAATYVLMISVFNMAGRFFWASTSDYLGRKSTYTIFFVLGAVLYASIPYTAEQVSASPAIVWLIYFYGATMLIFTMYGGGFATIPAYLADLFGSKFVGGIHGRLLTAWSTAGVLGPLAITSLRELSLESAGRDLAGRIDPALFAASFGAPISSARIPDGSEDGHHRQADGDRAGRDRRPLQHGLQHYDVLDGRSSRNRAGRQSASETRRRETLLGLNFVGAGNRAGPSPRSGDVSRRGKQVPSINVWKRQACLPARPAKTWSHCRRLGGQPLHSDLKPFVVLIQGRGVVRFWPAFELAAVGQQGLHHFVPQDHHSGHGTQSGAGRLIALGRSDLLHEALAAQFLEIVGRLPRFL